MNRDDDETGGAARQPACLHRGDINDMRVLVTGSNGLIGSEAVVYFDGLGAEVVGVDNNMRATFFGPGGDTRWNQRRLEGSARGFRHVELDIRDREGVLKLLADTPVDLIVHCAAQPSHDLAAKMPFEDFDVNAGGTLNLLEATRRHRPDAVFVLMSTNKVYGDSPNESRWSSWRPAGSTPTRPTTRGSPRTAGSTGRSTRSSAPRRRPPT